MIKNDLYEVFHQNTGFQRRIISDTNFTYRHILRTINQFIQPHSKVLDIGCGAGTLACYLASRGHTVLGIDISKKAILSAKTSAKILGLPNAHFTVMDFPNTYPKEKYDFIICSEVIEHLPDDDKALRVMYRLLKKGGIVLITTPSKNAPLYRWHLAEEFDKQVGHLRRYTVVSLVRKAKKNRFTVLATEKQEGLLRNFLFLNPYAGKTVRFIKLFLSDVVTVADAITRIVFGESNLFLVIKKK